MIRLSYAPDLVEEAVLLAERTMPVEERRIFRHERDRLYDIADPDERERRFQTLHTSCFLRLGLERSVDDAVAARLDGVTLAEGRVVAALSAREEGADLVDRAAGSRPARPLLVIRLRPATLLDPTAVRALLQHELMHVSDMLDATFGYERALPESDEGPLADNIVRDRYRVLWDVTIDGRLARAGLLPNGVRTARCREFVGAFPMLAGGARAAFDRWFDDARPTHAELSRFARSPAVTSTPSIRALVDR